MLRIPRLVLLGLACLLLGACGKSKTLTEPKETAERVGTFFAPRVTWAVTSFTTRSNGIDRQQLRLEDKLVVTVSCPRASKDAPAIDPKDTKWAEKLDPRTLEGWMAKVHPPTKPEDIGNAINKLVPYIDGVAIRGTYPIAVCHCVDGDADSKVETVRFLYRLTREETNKEAWVTLLARPGRFGTSKAVTLTLGTETGETMATDFDNNADQLPGEQRQVQLMIISKWWPIPAGGVLALAVCMYLLIRHSGLVRDTNNNLTDAREQPYSLAKLQMAVWFVVVLGAYVLMWFITRSRPNLPGTVLTLIGLSSATGIGALIIDGQKRATRRELQVKMEQTKKAVEEAITRNQGLTGEAGDAAAKELLELRKTVDNAKKELADLGTFAAKTEGFIKDILNDGNGVTLHRLQIAVWTVVLCLIFIVTTWRSLSMPEFDEGLLALMGISSGTYLGFKGVEKGARKEET